MAILGVNITEPGRQRLAAILVFFNSLIVLVGFSILGVGVFVKIFIASKMDILQHYSGEAVAYLLLSTGGLIIVIHGFGILLCVKLRSLESRKRFESALSAYGLMHVLVFLVVVACMITCFAHRMLLHMAFQTGFLQLMGRYKTDSDVKVMIDQIQTGLACCGSKTFGDWFSVSWIDTQYANITEMYDFIHHGEIFVDSVPFSCCSPLSARPCIHHRVTTMDLHYNYNKLTLHRHGCAGAMGKELDSVLHTFGIVTATVAGLQLVSWLLYRYLQTSISRASFWARDGEPAEGAVCEGCCICCQDLPELPRLQPGEEPGKQLMDRGSEPHLPSDYGDHGYSSGERESKRQRKKREKRERKKMKKLRRKQQRELAPMARAPSAQSWQRQRSYDQTFDLPARDVDFTSFREDTFEDFGERLSNDDERWERGVASFEGFDSFVGEDETQEILVPPSAMNEYRHTTILESPTKHARITTPVSSPMRPAPVPPLPLTFDGDFDSSYEIPSPPPPPPIGGLTTPSRVGMGSNLPRTTVPSVRRVSMTPPPVVSSVPLPPPPPPIGAAGTVPAPPPPPPIGASPPKGARKRSVLGVPAPPPPPPIGGIANTPSASKANCKVPTPPISTGVSPPKPPPPPPILSSVPGATPGSPAKQATGVPKPPPPVQGKASKTPPPPPPPPPIMGGASKTPSVSPTKSTVPKPPPPPPVGGTPPKAPPPPPIAGGAAKARSASPTKAAGVPKPPPPPPVIGTSPGKASPASQTVVGGPPKPPPPPPLGQSAPRPPAIGKDVLRAPPTLSVSGGAPGAPPPPTGSVPRAPPTNTGVPRTPTPTVPPRPPPPPNVGPGGLRTPPPPRMPGSVPRPPPPPPSTRPGPPSSPLAPPRQGPPSRSTSPCRGAYRAPPRGAPFPLPRSS